LSLVGLLQLGQGRLVCVTKYSSGQLCERDLPHLLIERVDGAGQVLDHREALFLPMVKEVKVKQAASCVLALWCQAKKD